MFFLFSTRLRRWIALAVVAPLLGRALQRTARTIDARRGPTPSAARLDRAGTLLRNRRQLKAFSRRR
jgi:hypothetical protein